MASVSVSLDGNIIHARYVGAMTSELVRQGERDIETLIGRRADLAILYDCVEMDPPPMNLALQMKSFDDRVRSRVVCCATVVKDAMTAFLSKVAFALARNHRVFYNDLAAATAWLRSSTSTQAANRPSAHV